MKLSNMVKHFKKICVHKYWVGYYCFKAGIPWRGLKHDMSKFSPTEFFESVKYYQGNRSPIEASKEENGYSKAWLHHKGRNTHHYQYWIDNFDNGGEPIKMPYEDAVELVCDYLGAARAYMDKDFSYEKEYQWWKKKCQESMLMHPHTKAFIDYVLYSISMCYYTDINIALWPFRLKVIYDHINDNGEYINEYLLRRRSVSKNT